MVKVKLASEVPQGLVIVMGILNVPDAVGVPEITPSVELKLRPAGKLAPMLKVIAPAVVGVVVAVKVYEKA
jgi:hypothetical protein